jgi:hypothetical protein
MKGNKRKRSVDRGRSSKGDRQEKLLGEACFSEEGDGSLLAEEVLGDGQVEKSRQAVWNPEQGERDPLRRERSSIASQPLVP